MHRLLGLERVATRGESGVTFRVCLTGAESTGKSTLAPRLARAFKAALMPEYGREWAETHGTDFPVAALRAIAHGHIARRAEIEARRPVIIVEDTDIVTTCAWDAMLHGRLDPELAGIPATADLYLLFAADTQWVPDGTRAFGGDRRLAFDAALRGELARRGITPIVIAGGWSRRTREAKGAIASALALRQSAQP